MEPVPRCSCTLMGIPDGDPSESFTHWLCLEQGRPQKTPFSDGKFEESLLKKQSHQDLDQNFHEIRFPSKSQHQNSLLHGSFHPWRPGGPLPGEAFAIISKIQDVAWHLDAVEGLAGGVVIAGAVRDAGLLWGAGFSPWNDGRKNGNRLGKA